MKFKVGDRVRVKDTKWTRTLPQSTSNHFKIGNIFIVDSVESLSDKSGQVNLRYIDFVKKDTQFVYPRGYSGCCGNSDLELVEKKVKKVVAPKPIRVWCGMRIRV